MRLIRDLILIIVLGAVALFLFALDDIYRAVRRGYRRAVGCGYCISHQEDER